MVENGREEITGGELREKCRLVRGLDEKSQEAKALSVGAASGGGCGSPKAVSRSRLTPSLIQTGLGYFSAVCLVLRRCKRR